MKILAAIGLFALWIALSASAHPAHLLAGAAVAGGIAWLNPIGLARVRRVSIGAAIAYAPWLFVRILKSGLHVSRLILHPALPISPRLIRYRTELESDGALVTIGNSITLTPGTITVEAKPGELLVHAIDEASSQDLVSGALEDKVRRVFPEQGGSK